MSATPMEQLQPPPPPVYVTQQAYTTHSHGSVGPLIAVLSVITILGVIAGMIGRLCSGGRVMGHGQHYDFEACVEKKCLSCIDGRIGPPLPPPLIPATTYVEEVPTVEEVPAVEPVAESPQEIKEEEPVQPQQQQKRQQKPITAAAVATTTTTTKSTAAASPSNNKKKRSQMKEVVRLDEGAF